MHPAEEAHGGGPGDAMVAYSPSPRERGKFDLLDETPRGLGCDQLAPAESDQGSGMSLVAVVTPAAHGGLEARVGQAPGGWAAHLRPEIMAATVTPPRQDVERKWSGRPSFCM